MDQQVRSGSLTEYPGKKASEKARKSMPSPAAFSIKSMTLVVVAFLSIYTGAACAAATVKLKAAFKADMVDVACVALRKGGGSAGQ